MGSVWAAADMGLHTQVAVKFLSQALLTDANTRARFEREGRLSAKIQSPHLVHVYDQGALEDGTPYIVMEWLEGESLKEMLAREHRLPPRQAVSVVVQICKALQKAHDLGVIHRDVKPDNIFVLGGTSDIAVKLLDFGVAKATGMAQDSVVTGQQETLGTPSYMSPEQLRHAAKVDYRTDLWSVGVLAYILLLGDKPFTGDDFPSMLVAIVEADYKPPSHWDAAWPSSLDNWFVRAFKIKAAGRFHSAEEAGTALMLAVGELGDVQPAGVVEKDDEDEEEEWDAKTVPHHRR
jgi:serine/threonine-protein kinase